MQAVSSSDHDAQKDSEREALDSSWAQVRALCGSCIFGAFATVGPDGWPQITPIGSVTLHPTEPRGYYHPVFTTRLRKGLSTDGRFELLFVDSRASSWLKALVRGRFDRPIAVRLRGRARGPRRPSTEQEVARFHRRVRAVRWTRGYELLWKDVRFVQELEFESLVPLRLGAMPHP